MSLTEHKTNIFLSNIKHQNHAKKNALFSEFMCIFECVAYDYKAALLSTPVWTIRSALKLNSRLQVGQQYGFFSPNYTVTINIQWNITESICDT